MPARWMRQLFSAFLCLGVLSSVSPGASAAIPEDGLSKGITAAQDTRLEDILERSTQNYPRQEPEVRQVKIGLCYGDGTLYNAAFSFPGQGGFFLGRFDEDRVFHSESTCSGAWLSFESDDEGLWLRWENNEKQLVPGETVAFMPQDHGLISFEGCRYRGGFECRADEMGRFTVINVLPLEDYVKGVVPYEMSASWPMEALKAQAVCARTYVVYNQNAYEELGFDLTDDTESQVYRGVNEATEETDRAVDETAGLFVRYHGEICDIYYFASDGGATEDAEQVFGIERPYLKGVTDPFEDAEDYSIRDWVSYRSGETLAYLLAVNGLESDTIVKLSPEYSDHGNVIALTLTDASGAEHRLERRDVYRFLRLNNCRFQISEEEDLFVFRGDGWGHNCGLSQWGAKAMAGVYGYRYEDIISFYFTGAYVG